MRSYRSFSAAGLVIVASALVGGFWGHGGALSAQDQIPDRYRTFAAALSAIEATYVGEVQSDRLVNSAITGMLQTLDPHSSFMDPRGYKEMRERQEGRYYGLGISIQVVDGDIMIGNVFEGSPAYEKGLRRGDVIARIEGEDTKGWPTTRAVERLRGPKGTFVGISVRRGGRADLIGLQVRRDEVRMPMVPAAVMLDDTTGYIKLQDFGETSDQELVRALRDLTQQGMKRLVFDLRANPGGALRAAINVSNRFLRKGELIVYTQGRVRDSTEEYFAPDQSDYLTLPMVTLVNRSSASASEIVAGALQDHDRSLIVGETTFGKALVQTVYPIQGHAAAITTARYYTPRGRLIQRPWDGSFDEYLTYTWREQDANKARRPEDLMYTDAGRKVYSGGGIEPDRRFDGPFEGFNPTRFSRTLAARNLFDVYAQRFSRRGDTRIAPGPGARELESDFEVTEAMVAEFKQLAQQAPVKWDEAAWQQDRQFIVAMIRREIDVDLFGVAAAYRNLARNDPQLQFAVSLFPEAQQLLELRRTTGRRASR